MTTINTEINIQLITNSIIMRPQIRRGKIIIDLYVNYLSIQTLHNSDFKHYYKLYNLHRSKH